MCIHTHSTHLTQCTHPECTFHIRIGTQFEVYGFLARNEEHAHITDTRNNDEHLERSFSSLFESPDAYGAHLDMSTIDQPPINMQGRPLVHIPAAAAAGPTYPTAHSTDTSRPPSPIPDPTSLPRLTLPRRQYQPLPTPIPSPITPPPHPHPDPPRRRPRRRLTQEEILRRVFVPDKVQYAGRPGRGRGGAGGKG
ncbi:hypothetical protein H2201_006336 [Coniosporium apollinis]|uniref:Uncharacterized protein n=1 Tax=Coniosporium apollinis TaxID=61459 RepID=A0ABQ9NNW5_9PEZI|nr:hypothetical protein H2201_006336 [Coniosporium apollinis]